MNILFIKLYLRFQRIHELKEEALLKGQKKLQMNFNNLVENTFDP